LLLDSIVCAAFRSELFDRAGWCSPRPRAGGLAAGRARAQEDRGVQPKPWARFIEKGVIVPDERGEKRPDEFQAVE